MYKKIFIKLIKLNKIYNNIDKNMNTMIYNILK